MLEILDNNAPLVVAVILFFLALCILLASISVVRRINKGSNKNVNKELPSSSLSNSLRNASNLKHPNQNGALKHSRSPYRTNHEDIVAFEAFSHTPFSALLAIDPQARAIINIAGSFEEITGLSKGKVLTDAHALDMCIDDNERRRIMSTFDKWDKASVLALECDLINNTTNNTLHCDMSIYPDPSTHLWVMELRDITESFQEITELTERAFQAEENERAKLRFLSDMSHEIRTPMNGIMGTLALAKLHTDEPQKIQEYLEQADDLTTYLLSIINNVLDISKIENGKMELEDRCFSLNDILNQMRNLFGESTKMKGINYVVTSNDDNPPFVVGDELRLVQVITNLVSNAQKFTSSGGTIKVELFLTQSTEERLHFMIRVSDTGKGMEKEFLKTIFDPFSQESSSTSRQFGGTGLGMAISDQIIRLMGGYIIVESELGRGSTFEIYLVLPIANDEQIMEYKKEHASTAAELQENGTQENLFSIKDSVILLAEDNMLNAAIAQDMLLEMGAAKVDHASDGAIACEMFEQSSPNGYSIILMDIQMPNMDGRTAAENIRAMGREDAQSIPIIALSADAYVEDKRASRKAGMNGHISKPIVYEMLEQQICEELASSMQGEEIL